MLRALFRLVLLLVLAGVSGMAALVALGPDRLADYLPPPVADVAADAVADLTAAIGIEHLAGTGAKRAGTPEDLLADTNDGLVAQGPIAAMAGNVPVFIDSVLAGHATRISRDTPAEITTIRPILGCLLTGPAPGTVVGHVTSGVSDLPLALTTYDDTDLALAVQALVDLYRQSAVVRAEVPASLDYQAYDVAVTETSAPVYLVLENTGGNRIWNIHLAPGARIDRVVLLGGGQAGVANLDAVVPVEVLLDQGMEDCGIAPAHPLNPGHRLFQAVAAGELSAAELATRLAEQDAAVAAYDQWFRDSFGVPARNRAGFDRGAVSVVGPIPATEADRAVYSPIDGADIRMTQDSYFEIRGQVPEGQDFAARVLAIATDFALGDLTMLRQGVDF